jgi:hypothetical protein
MGRHCEREGLLRRHDGPDPGVTQTAGQAPVGHTDTRPAPGSEDTELGVLMELEVGHERRKFTREFKLEAVRLIQGSRRVLCAETVPRQDLPDR